MPRSLLSTRWLLATGLVISAMLCCCQGKSVGSALAGLFAAPVAGAMEHGCCSDGSSEEIPSPSDHRDRPCDCNTHELAKNLSDAKPVIEAAGATPVVPAPERASVEPLTQAAPLTRRVEARAEFRPPSSLLRQHCALIV